MSSGSGVLDVAGGQGSLGWEMLNYNHIPVTVVDPRPCIRARKFERLFEYHTRRQSQKAAEQGQADHTSVALRTPRHWPVYWRDSVWRPVSAARADASPDGKGARGDTPEGVAAFAEALRSRPPQVNSARRARKGLGHHQREISAASAAAGGGSGPAHGGSGSGGNLAGDDGDGGGDSALPALPSPSDAWAVLRDCSMAVGMHPDSATESIVDFALAMDKPFAVVPCCVCAVDFPDRAVSTYREFVSYLAAKAPGRIGVVEIEGFEGRNICVYSLPGKAQD